MVAMACDGVRQRRQLRRLTRHEIASRYRTLTAEGAQGPPEARHVGADDGGGLCAVSNGAEAAGTLEHGYLRTGPLPRVPLRDQSTLVR